MRFFFDESGDFAPAGSKEHKCSVVCAVVVPDTIAASLETAFADFVAKLSREERLNGEPKGSLLNGESRLRFCWMLHQFPQVLVTPVIADLSFEIPCADIICENMKLELERAAEEYIYQGPRDSMRKLAKQWNNLSHAQCFRLLAMTSCFWEAFQHCVLFLSNRQYDSCWDRLSFCVDAVKKKPDARENLVFRVLVMAWLSSWSKQRPLKVIEGIHTKDHPLVRRFAMGTKYDIGAILRHNIELGTSKDSWGLQISDIAANIVYQAAHDLNNTANKLPLFRDLMENCPYPPDYPPMVVLLEPFSFRPDTAKYDLLADYMLNRIVLREPAARRCSVARRPARH